MPLKEDSNEQQKEYSKAVRKVLKYNGDFTIAKDGLKYLVCIITSISKDLVEFTRNEAIGSELTCSNAEAAVRQFPKGLQKCAIAEGRKALFMLEQGELVYDGSDKPPRPKACKKPVKPDVFKNGLLELAGTVSQNREFTLTPQAVKLGCDLMHNLAQTIISRAISEVRDEPEMTVDHMRASVAYTMSPEELLELAQVRAEMLLEFYSNDLLQCDIQAFSQRDRQKKIFVDGLKKFAASFSVTLDEDSLILLDKILTRVATKIASISDENSLDTVDFDDVFNAAFPVFPRAMFSSANSHAEANIFNYNCGNLKYNRTPARSTVTTTLPAPSFNFRSMIRARYPDLSFSRSALYRLSDLLLKICQKLVSKTVELCDSRNSRLMTRFEVLEAATTELPGQLYNHAAAHLAGAETNLLLIERQQEPPYFRDPSNTAAFDPMSRGGGTAAEMEQMGDYEQDDRDRPSATYATATSQPYFDEQQLYQPSTSTAPQGLFSAGSGSATAPQFNGQPPTQAYTTPQTDAPGTNITADEEMD